MPSPCGEGGREALERGEISGNDVDAKEPIEVDKIKWYGETGDRG